MKNCKDCKHRITYEAVGNRGCYLEICSGDGWEEEGDGSYKLTEVSRFDAKDCILFHAMEA